MNKTVSFRKYRYKKPKITGPCAPLRIIRTLTMAGNIEQRPWTPTVRTRRIAAETSNPGPAIVQLPTLIGSKVPDSKKKGAPAYSFGHKPASKDETTGPGPAQYNVSGMVPRGKECPHAATLQSRPKELSRFVNPGPGEYDVMNATKAVIDAPPKYTFGKRPPHAKYQLIPAPNVYKIPTVLGSSKEGQIRSAPAYTMAGRMRPSLIPKLVLPGPGYYDGEYTATKTKPPIYSMRGKFDMITDNNKPGPGAHCPEKYWEKRSTPSISFGIAHSRFCGRPTQYLLPDRFVNCLLANRPDRNYA